MPITLPCEKNQLFFLGGIFFFFCLFLRFYDKRIGMTT